MSTVIYSVPAISCQHCVAAITSEVGTVPGVASIEVSVDHRTVTVTGEADRAAIEAAIDEAGYEVAGCEVASYGVARSEVAGAGSAPADGS